MRKWMLSFALLTILILTAGWGSKGHRKISDGATYILPAPMAFLNPGWMLFVVNHAMDPDNRKDQDPFESARHYIDIDNYPEFVSGRSIHHSMDTNIFRHGYAFVNDQGILPWATLRAYDSLKSCFQRGDWERSALFAADLGHYVADGHMPLHITKNYNGQMTGQSGVHSRYETGMINRYESQIVYEADSAQYISSVTGFIFNYLYSNYSYVDSILLADKQASLAAGSVTSSNYYQEFWNRTGTFTKHLMSRASYSLGSLIYTAWVDAGSPLLFPAGISRNDGIGSPFAPIYPLPASTVVSIPLHTGNSSGDYEVVIMDMRGKICQTLSGRIPSISQGQLSLDVSGLTNGMYMCLLKNGGSTSSRKLVVLK